MKRRFVKMQGAGNDYIYFDCLSEPFSVQKSTVQKLCDRHFSIGGDGVVLIEPSIIADCKMKMYNADGSEGAMCGNAVRCVAKYLAERKNLKKRVLLIETDSGIKTLFMPETSGDISVDMGLAEEKEMPSLPFAPTYVKIGNEHLVFFTPYREETLLGIERSGLFQDGINVEFVERVKKDECFVRVFERGSGETLACGTGACAVATAYFSKKKGADGVFVTTKGGTLRVEKRSGHLYLSGDAEITFDGETEINI